MSAPEHFQLGDVISIAGLYADGTKEQNDTPRELYADKPEQIWRVAFIGPHGVKLVPLKADGSVDEFNALASYWITSAGGSSESRL